MRGGGDADDDDCGHMFVSRATHITGTTHNAHVRKAILRARLVLAPRLISHEESPPPPMLPTSASKYTTNSGQNTCCRSMP